MADGLFFSLAPPPNNHFLKSPSVNRSSLYAYGGLTPCFFLPFTPRRGRGDFLIISQRVLFLRIGSYMLFPLNSRPFPSWPPP